MYHIAFYVPEDHAEKVKELMFAAGAGNIGNYSRCSFEYKGLGQFMPLSGSDPFIGKEQELEKVSELKVEMVCQKDAVHAVIKALKEAHPYETPAYYVTETLKL
jgi:structural toxin protein (hemagglutinin/hemolysin) RtxA